MGGGGGGGGIVFCVGLVSTVCAGSVLLLIITEWCGPLFLQNRAEEVRVYSSPTTMRRDWLGESYVAQLCGCVYVHTYAHMCIPTDFRDTSSSRNVVCFHYIQHFVQAYLPYNACMHQMQWSFIFVF